MTEIQIINKKKPNNYDSAKCIRTESHTQRNQYGIGALPLAITVLQRADSKENRAGDQHNQNLT